MCIHWAPTRLLCQFCGQELLFHTRVTAAGIPAARQPPERPRIYHLPKRGHAKDKREKKQLCVRRQHCYNINVCHKNPSLQERTKNTHGITLIFQNFLQCLHQSLNLGTHFSRFPAPLPGQRCSTTHQTQGEPIGFTWPLLIYRFF